MRQAALIALAVLFAAPAGAGDQVTSGKVTGNSTVVGDGGVLKGTEGDQDAELLLIQYGGQIGEMGETFAANRKKYQENPNLLANLAREKLPPEAFTNPAFEKALVNQFLNQLIDPAKTPPPSNPTPAVVKPENGAVVTPARPSYGEEYLRGIQRADPAQNWVNEEVGKRAFQRNDYQASFRDYGRALDSGDTRPEVYVGYGVSALQLKDYAIAQQAAKIVLSANPKDADALTLYYASKGRVPAVNLPSVLGGEAPASIPPASPPLRRPPRPPRAAGAGRRSRRSSTSPRRAPRPRPPDPAPPPARPRSPRTRPPRSSRATSRPPISSRARPSSSTRATRRRSTTARSPRTGCAATATPSSTRAPRSRSSPATPPPCRRARGRSRSRATIRKPCRTPTPRFRASPRTRTPTRIGRWRWRA
ncbi:MAG: hypothetical protein M0D55_14715 [Elusimicrobiota bacterium]|nr:MAG: hypothetical protein M0D55_14715 [Elusimicrobiota bacterium]